MLATRHVLPRDVGLQTAVWVTSPPSTYPAVPEMLPKPEGAPPGPPSFKWKEGQAPEQVRREAGSICFPWLDVRCLVHTRRWTDRADMHLTLTCPEQVEQAQVYWHIKSDARCC